MISEKDVLFVVDGDNIFRSVQTYHGKDKRVSYLKLIELLKKDRPVNLCYHLAVFVTLKYGVNTQLQFISRLSSMGYDIHTYVLEYNDKTGEIKRHDYIEEMIQYIKNFRCDDNYPKNLVVASANGALADLYTALSWYGISIEVMFVGDTLSQKVKDVEKRTVLGEEVLYIQ